ncbi:hypothetical protein ACTXT7_008322 [Hymenolepis weldensis]
MRILPQPELLGNPDSKVENLFLFVKLSNTGCTADTSVTDTILHVGYREFYRKDFLIEPHQICKLSFATPL